MLDDWGLAPLRDQERRELPWLTEVERRQIVETWNATRATYPSGSVISAFESIVRQSPNATALVDGSVELTYEALGRRSNQLARVLRERGARAESLVGICLERSIDTIVAVLGVLKAGAAYVPLDPTYPEERLAFMVADARCALLVTSSKAQRVVADSGAALITLDDEAGALAAQSPSSLETELSPHQLAYVIYTSGSIEAFFNHSNGVVGWAAADDFTVEYSRLHDNGQTGVSVGGKNAVVRHNDLVHNNIFGFWRNDGASGGLKADLATYSKVTNNLVTDNLSFGIYYDENADYGLIADNYVANNWAAGINFVFSRWGKIANNVTVDNGHDFYKGRNSSACSEPTRANCLNAGIYLANASDTEVVGNTVKGNANAIILTEFARDQATVPWVVPHTAGNKVHGNVVTVGGHSTGARQFGGPAGYDITKSNNRFYDNTYHLVSPTGAYFWWNSLLNRTQWQAAGQDTTSTFLSP